MPKFERSFSHPPWSSGQDSRLSRARPGFDSLWGSYSFCHNLFSFLCEGGRQVDDALHVGCTHVVVETCWLKAVEELKGRINLFILQKKSAAPHTTVLVREKDGRKKKTVLQPGIEPGAYEWESYMLPLHY